MKSLFRGMSKAAIEEVAEQSDASINNEAAVTDEADCDAVVKETLTVPARGPKRSTSVTPSGSRTSLRHQLYPMEDDKNTGRGYTFWSKFF